MTYNGLNTGSYIVIPVSLFGGNCYPQLFIVISELDDAL